MTDEERTIITGFIQRVGGGSPAAQGSVPATTPALPAIDPDADRLIGELFDRYPQAKYRLTQTAFVQEHALAEAQTRIAQLQAELARTRSAPVQPQAQGGFFQNLFGGAARPASTQQSPPQPQAYQPYPNQPPPAPQYASQPAYAAPPPGLMQRSGSGFLGSALTTAAGVAGGMVAGNALMNLFEGPREFGGGMGGNMGYGYDQGGGGPWGAPMPDAQATGSAWDNATENSQPAGWDQDDQGGWDNGGGGGGTGTGTGNNGGF